VKRSTIGLLIAVAPATLHGQTAAVTPVPVVSAVASPLIVDVPGIQRRFVTANGARLQYLHFPGKGPAVILLAGLGNTAWIWSEFGPRLADEGFDVFALTRRAHGESEAPPSGYSLDTLAADVISLMDSLGIAKAHIIGHSLAGAELTRIAGRYPDRVNRLVYIDAAYDRADQKRRDELISPPDIGRAMTGADRASLKSYLAYQKEARPDLARAWSQAVERDYSASLVADASGAVKWRQPFARYGQIIDAASLAAPDYASVRAPALALYATVPQEVLPPNAPDSIRAQMARFQKENAGPWRTHSIEQFKSGVGFGKVIEVGGVHHLFLDRADETLVLISTFLHDRN
jgi:pimeloyl-ACP methyl ester carboxylesterase